MRNLHKTQPLIDKSQWFWYTLNSPKAIRDMIAVRPGKGQMSVGEKSGRRTSSAHTVRSG